MRYNHSLIKELFQLYLKTDVRQPSKDHSTVTYTPDPVRVASLKTPDNSYEIPIYLLSESDDIKDSIIKTTDGEIAVYLTQRSVDELSDLQLYPFAVATIAHELGHFLAGHLSREEKLSWLNVNREEQRLLVCQYIDNPSEYNETLYYRSVFFSLLRGGVLDVELEADLWAVALTDLASVVAMRSRCAVESVNPFAALEQRNRIKQLIEYHKKNPDEDREVEFSLRVPDRTPDEVSTPTLTA